MKKQTSWPYTIDPCNLLFDIHWHRWNRMATPTHETTETHCDKISYSWVSQFGLHNLHICHNSIHKSSSRFLDFLLIIFVWCFLFGLVFCALCSSTTTWSCYIDQEVTTQQIISISILMFTGMLQSYLTFEAINMSIQKPCILYTHFTQVYWALTLCLLYYY